MTSSIYHYDHQLINDFLSLVFTHNGKVYGGFVRDFIARDYIREHGYGTKTDSVEYKWKAEDRHCLPIPGVSESITTDASVIGFLKKYLRKDIKYTIDGDIFRVVEREEMSRLKDIDVWFTKEEDRVAFIAALEKYKGSKLSLSPYVKEDNFYPFNVTNCGGFNIEGRILPSSDLTVCEHYPVNDSPVNLLSYDGNVLEVNAPVDQEQAPSLSIVLGMINRWEYRVYKGVLEGVKGVHLHQMLRLERKHSRGWIVCLPDSTVFGQSSKSIYQPTMKLHVLDNIRSFYQ